MVKHITVLGATGSIGQSSLALVRQFPDQYQICGLVAGANAPALAALAREFFPRIVGIADPSKFSDLRDLLTDTGIEVVAGVKACAQIAAIPVDLVIAGVSGLAGLPGVMAAVDAGQRIGLANKESLVSAGAVVMRHVAQSGAHILPLDSEHNAIFQCWTGWPGYHGAGRAGENTADIRHICLTASGGPFLHRPLAQFDQISRQDALQHPNFEMGQKISVDSATMMNKGLEVIEAHWLFGLPPEKIDALIHPQQAIHGLVYFADGSVVAQLADADMRTPISYAMAWPDRLPWHGTPLDLTKLADLAFLPIDLQRYPCFGLARAALVAGGVTPAVLNAANEVAVAAFLDGRITFPAIASVVEACLDTSIDGDVDTLDAVLDIDRASRRHATDHIARVSDFKQS